MNFCRTLISASPEQIDLQPQRNTHIHTHTHKTDPSPHMSCIDIIAVLHADKSSTSSSSLRVTPFFVRFRQPARRTCTVQVSMVIQTETEAKTEVPLTHMVLEAGMTVPYFATAGGHRQRHCWQQDLEERSGCAEGDNEEEEEDLMLLAAMAALFDGPRGEEGDSGSSSRSCSGGNDRGYQDQQEQGQQAPQDHEMTSGSAALVDLEPFYSAWMSTSDKKDKLQRKRLLKHINAQGRDNHRLEQKHSQLDPLLQDGSGSSFMAADIGGAVQSHVVGGRVDNVHFPACTDQSPISRVARLKNVRRRVVSRLFSSKHKIPISSVTITTKGQAKTAMISASESTMSPPSTPTTPILAPSTGLSSSPPPPPSWRKRLAAQLLQSAHDELLYPHEWLIPSPDQMRYMQQTLDLMYTSSGDSHVKLVFRKVKKLNSNNTRDSSGMVTALAQVSSNLLMATQTKSKSKSKFTKRSVDNSADMGDEEEEEVTGRLFLWRHSDRVVISDIDGTITMSDVRGHLLTRLGKDWVHEGVCSLYGRIARNGYRLLYLTARPASMAGSTSQFIANVKQQTSTSSGVDSDGQQRQTVPPRFQTLPPGPVITAYNNTRNALLREVVLRRPEAFKIYILHLIGDAFEPSMPFVCGFGNRVTDDLTYERLSVPKSRIFRINTGSRITTPLLLAQDEEFRVFRGYSDMESHIDQLLPPLTF